MCVSMEKLRELTEFVQKFGSGKAEEDDEEEEEERRR